MGLCPASRVAVRVGGATAELGRQDTIDPVGMSLSGVSTTT